MSSPVHILGHKAQRADLLRDAETGNVAHAYLFTGPAHIGKFTVAKWFAEMLLLDGVPSEDIERSTNEISRLMHPDLLVLDQLWMEDVQEDPVKLGESTNISQEHRKKAGAKTDTISIDDVRALQARLHGVPQHKYRVCLVRSVERMQDEGVNALLKILEEPPEGVVFLLTAASEDHVLPTLLSRSRRLSFARLGTKELIPLVADLSDDERQFLLHLSQGAPGIVERLRANPEQLRSEQTLAGTARAFWQERSLASRITSLAPINDRGEDADRFLFHLCLTARQLPSADRTKALAALRGLLRGLETNVSRQMLCQRFALSL